MKNRHWLFEAKKRHDLALLNYVITSNHVHLLVEAGEDMRTVCASGAKAPGRFEAPAGTFY